MTVFALYPSRRHPDTSGYILAQLSLLNEVQRDVILQFLTFVAENGEFVQRPDAQKAIDRFWKTNVRRPASV